MEKNRYFDYVMGCAIEASRKKAKKTKKALYTHMGISRQTYERYIKGETHAPIPLMLKALLYCGISDWKELGEERLTELRNSDYGRTLLKWRDIKKED